MDRAVERILQALQKGEIICVYGDFDADGVTSTTLLVEALQAAGGRVGAYIPDRVDEGYGLNVQSITERIAGKAQLIITVDCGIRSTEEVAAAVGIGLDVIVTDHHSVGRDLPPALAVINPQRRDCESPYKRLAGVGVAYRLAQAVLREASQQSWCKLSPEEAAEVERSLLDLVAVGTVADLMPLTGENRSLVRRGLDQLRRGQRVGLYTLLETASVTPQAVDSTAISFRIAPRINAAGRLDHAKLAYELLRCRSYTDAYDQSIRLEHLNRERQALTRDAQKLAESQLPGDETQPSLIFAASTSFRSGIVGLVAGRLVERFYRPAVVVEQGAQESRGSARSIDEFDITAALDQVSHLLVRHGGHSRAAGFTVTNERLPELVEALTAIAAAQLEAHDDLRPTLWLDAELVMHGDALNWALHAQLARLEPVGQENRPPLFLSRRCYVRDVRTVGSDSHHLKLLFGAPGEYVYDAIGFGMGEHAVHLAEGTYLDVVYQLEANEWQGRRTLQLNIQDLRVAE
jgi:single-stranded-DNA-specific exonuclease